MSKERIIAVKRDNLDRIVEFKTDKNKIYNYEMAKEAISNGLIENALIIKNKNSLLQIIEKNNKNLYNSFEKMEEFR